MINDRLLEELHISDISVISGIRPCGRRNDYTRNGRKTCGILYVWQGEATFYKERGAQQLTATDGALVYLPKGARYTMQYTAPSTVFVVVNFEVYDSSNRELALFEDITVSVKEDRTRRIAQTMTDFELCGSAKTVGAALRKKELMYRLLGLIYTSELRMLSRDTVNGQILEGVRLLEGSYLENLPIARFAEASHVSINTFRTLFHKQYGISPVKYRNQLRIERARELLRDGELTVAEVAYASGFENVGYFCRYYRKITGEAPGNTKKRNNDI